MGSLLYVPYREPEANLYTKTSGDDDVNSDGGLYKANGSSNNGQILGIVITVFIVSAIAIYAYRSLNKK